MSPSIWDCAWSVTRTLLIEPTTRPRTTMSSAMTPPLRCVAEQERTAMDVALDLTVDLDLTLGGDIAGDRKALAHN
jgi:hypothetical protein